MRFTRLERNGLALVVLLFGSMLAMYISEQVTHRPVSPVWQLPFGGIVVLMGIHVIRFRQELADKYNEGVKRYPWMSRTGDSYFAPVFMVFPGVMFIFLGIVMMVTGVVKLV